MVRQDDVFTISQVRVMADRRVQVEKYWQVDLFVGVDQLVLEAEALDLVEVHGQFFREDLIDSDSCNRFIRPIIHLVEGQGRLTRIHCQGGGLGLELPWNLILSMAHESHLEFAENVDVLVFHSVVFCMLTHGEAHGLADDVVEGDGQEVAT